MKNFRMLALTITVTGAAVAVIGLAAQAGGDKVAFPADHAKGVLYTTVDRADNKQVREFFAPPPRSTRSRRASRCRAARC